MRHAKNTHPKEWEKSKKNASSDVTTPITKHFLSPKEIKEKQDKYKKNSKKQLDFERNLVLTFAKHDYPLRFIEHQQLRKLFNCTEDGHKFNWPSRFKFTEKIIPRVYNEEERKLMKEIDEQKHLSVTTDLWSDTTADSHNGVTGHWFNKKTFEIESRLIDVSGFKEAHTGENLRNELDVVFDKYRMRDKLVLGKILEQCTVGKKAHFQRITKYTINRKFALKNTNFKF